MEQITNWPQAAAIIAIVIGAAYAIGCMFKAVGGYYDQPPNKNTERKDDAKQRRNIK